MEKDEIRNLETSKKVAVMKHAEPGSLTASSTVTVDYIVTGLLLLGVVRWEQGTDKKISSHVQRATNERMEDEQWCPLIAPAYMIDWIEERCVYRVA
jgi:hypothetical protein